ENPKHLRSNADTSITATFRALLPNLYQLDVRTVGQGSVGAEPLGPYPAKQVVTLTATPAPGWQFAGWSGGVNGTANPVGLAITANTIVTATFTEKPKPQHTLDIAIVGSGVVTRMPDQNAYPDGQVITLTAIPDPGWVFA